MRRFGWTLVVCAIAIAGYVFTRSDLRPLPVWLGGEEEVAVRVAAVRKVTAPIALRLSGELAPVKTVDIVSPLAGRVVDVRFKAGEAVRAGAVVATIHAGTLAQRIAELEAAVAAAAQDVEANEERLMEAEKQLARQRDFLRQDLIARRDLDELQTRAENARAQNDFARAQLSQQQAMLAQARALRRRTQLTAPFSGVISRRWAEPGAAVGESGAILTLADVASLKMIAAVDVKYSNDVHPGMPVEISRPSAPGQTLAGRVVRVDDVPEGDGERKPRVEIHTGVLAADFRPGMAVEAAVILARQRESLWAPRAALLSAEGKIYVYKFAGGRAVRRQITVGAEQDGQLEITGAVQEGDALIIDQHHLLKTNMRVRLSTAGERRAGKEK